MKLKLIIGMLLLALAAGVILQREAQDNVADISTPDNHAADRLPIGKNSNSDPLRGAIQKVPSGIENEMPTALSAEQDDLIEPSTKLLDSTQSDMADSKQLPSDTTPKPTTGNDTSKHIVPETESKPDPASNEAVSSSTRKTQIVLKKGKERSWVEGDEKLFLSPQEDPIQSPARPLGLEPTGPVQANVYDPYYAEFVGATLPEVAPFLEGHFSDRPEIENNSLELEMTDLVMPIDGDVRVYFIKEGTVFHNTLGMVRNGEEELIFPNASSFVSYFHDSETRTVVTREDAPLLPGDYVDIGRLKKGELIDLFLIKDGARDDNGDRYGLDKTKNPDELNHIRIHGQYNELLIIGFEDLPGGGDRDYNDLVIGIEVTAPSN